jgi:uncharacterized protein YcgI (DUF1989 family)
MDLRNMQFRPDHRSAPSVDTSTPASAREHARAQAGARADTMATIPVSGATDLPEGIDADALVWDETLGAGGYASRVLARGTRLRLVDLDADACVQLWAYNAATPVERLNPADTTKVQWNAYLGAGALLLSDLGRVLATVDHLRHRRAPTTPCAATPTARTSGGAVRRRRRRRRTARTRTPATGWLLAARPPRTSAGPT